MNIEERYERTLKRNEFVLTIDEYGINSDYQERMLLENDIAGLLTMKIEYKNEKKEYRYEISNKINLEDIGKGEKIAYDFLKNLLLQIAETLESLDRFMLEERKIIFNPSYIFFDKDTNKLFLLFFPERKEQEEDFLMLTEYLITIIDQEDELAVWAAYMLENDAKMENFSFLSFLNTMQMHEQEIKKDKIESSISEMGEYKNEMKKECKENNLVDVPINGYIRLGVGFGLSAIYFVGGNLITGRYAFEYKKSMILIGILVAITVGAILWTVFDMVKEKNVDGWEEQKERNID